MTDIRRQILDDFATASGLPRIDAVIQHGEEPQTARYTFRFTDGRDVRIGGIDILWSRTNLSKVLAVTIRATIDPCKPAEWTDRVSLLIKHAIDVEHRPGETFQDSVVEWLTAYAGRATNDREGAVPHGMPFTDDGSLYITANDVARYIRREYSEALKLAELRQALADLGFERIAVNYTRNGRGPAKRTSVSYYRGELALLDTGGDQ